MLSLLGVKYSQTSNSHISASDLLNFLTIYDGSISHGAGCITNVF